jgi:hypothetical protein
VNLENGHLRIHTTDHHLLLLRDGDVIKKYSVNCPETPKHLLWSSLSCNTLVHYAWDINEHRLEKCIDNNVVMHAENVPDLDSLE